MIQDLMRKHKTAFLWAILLLVVVPFVYWGAPFGGRDSREQSEAAKWGPIAEVGGVPIPNQLFGQELNEFLSQRRRFDPSLTLRDLHEDGSAMQIVERLVDETIFDLEAQNVRLAFDDALLTEELKKRPQFQRDGKFDKELWNAWLERGENRNWNQVYAEAEQALRYRILRERILASARVLDSDVRRQFEEDHTELRVRYVAVEPKVEPTEEQIQTQYQDNPERYETPEQRRARFVAVSLQAPMPELAEELVGRARTGEDFGELARTHTEGPYREQGGDLGWRAESPTLPEHLLPLFALSPGEVSDPVAGPGGGYYIFKLEEERTNETTGEREVRGRQIVLRPQLAEEELAARTAQAEAVLAQAREIGDLETAAGTTGLLVGTTGLFSDRSLAIENVPVEDATPFRLAVASLGLNELSGVIKGSSNLYVAQVTEVQPAVLPPLEEVRDRVVEDTIQSIKRSPEHQEEVARLTDEIMASVSSIDEIIAKYPDLDLVPAEMEGFSVAEPRPGVGPLWRAWDVFEAVGRGEPGAFGGPIQGYDGFVYFVELLSRTPPKESVWQEQWEKHEPLIRRRLLAQAQEKRLRDFCLDRRSRLTWRLNQETYDRVLGLDQPEEDLGIEQEPTDDTTAASSEPESLTQDTAAEETPVETAAPSVDTLPPGEIESTPDTPISE